MPVESRRRWRYVRRIQAGYGRCRPCGVVSLVAAVAIIGCDSSLTADGLGANPILHVRKKNPEGVEEYPNDGWYRNNICVRKSTFDQIWQGQRVRGRLLSTCACTRQKVDWSAHSSSAITQTLKSRLTTSLKCKVKFIAYRIKRANESHATTAKKIPYQQF